MNKVLRTFLPGIKFAPSAFLEQAFGPGEIHATDFLGSILNR